MAPLPIGIYERLVRDGEWEEVQKLVLEGRAWVDEPSDPQRRQLLADEFAARIPELLDIVTSGCEEDAEAAQRELRLIAALLKAARDSGASPESLPAPHASVRILRAVHEPERKPHLPRTGLRNSWLFTSAKGDPTLYSELRTELETAERLDLIISFIKWSGYRKLEDVFQRATAIDATGKGRLKVRILTTTYMGATDRRAVDALARLPGVEVRISLDGRRERLHAKAWLFGRANGFGTAFVGSANLSKSALIDGIEWTLKISQAREPALFEAAQANFETHWEDREFQPYDPNNESHAKALDSALREQRMDGSGPGPAIRTWFDLQPKPFQQAMLERLDHERAVGRRRNLLVAATGTGKTMVSAFDYQRLCEQAGGGRPKLLFVAHQRRILDQALATFRQVLRDSNFGEVMDGNNSPASYDHLFAMIQALHARGLVGQLGANYWWMVIVDEAHHVPAPTFDAFVRQVQPSILLGLTATPERADGRPWSTHFDARPDGTPAYSLRIWDALDQQLLAPFEYFATHDDLDLRQVDWGRAGELEQLGRIIGGNEIRARAVVNAIERYVDDPSSMKALAFCVNRDHARFMARTFENAGQPAVAVSGEDDQQSRNEAIAKLEAGELKVICAVNLFNEGVDIPSVNTLILLRPTQSPVLFQQQIGRGLRLHPGKSSCLVLDFIGQHGASYRFDVLYRALTGLGRKRLKESVENGFGFLPAGCHIQLDKVARERVLQSLKTAVNLNGQRLRQELSAWAATQFGTLRLDAFLSSQMIAASELYHYGQSWTVLKRDVNIPAPAAGARDADLLPRLGRLLHVNDPALIESWQGWLQGKEIETEALLMLAHQLLHEREPISVAAFRTLIEDHPAVKAELAELLGYLFDVSEIASGKVNGAPPRWPLRLHARYSRQQIQAAVGHSSESRRPHNREGLLTLRDQKTELLFVTLDKSKGFGESVQYADYAISPSRFHWKTQNSAKPTNASGRKYLESPANGWRFFLFVRETKDDSFAFTGQVEHESREFDGRGPIGITWKLAQPLDAGLFRRFSVLRDA
jgi:superfamily II DNA or RNA helicase